MFFTRLPRFGRTVAFFFFRSSRWYFRVRWSTNEHSDLVLSATGVGPSPAHTAPGAHASVALDSANAPRGPPVRPRIRWPERDRGRLQTCNRAAGRVRSKFWPLRHRARGRNCAATHVHIVRRKKYGGSVPLHTAGNFFRAHGPSFSHVGFGDIDRRDDFARTVREVYEVVTVHF